MPATRQDVTKQVWKFQEGLLYYTLCCLLPDEKDKIHWNYKRREEGTKKKYTPDLMSIDPDIVICDDYNLPDAILFVTHATAEMASQMKFWRTIAEAVEEKSLLSHPRIYSVLYAGSIKASIMDAYQMLFDGVYHMEDTGLDGVLSNKLFNLTEQYGDKAPEEIIPILEKEIVLNHELFIHYKNKVKEMLARKYGPFHNLLINSNRKKESFIPQQAKWTSIRRGLIKIHAFSMEQRLDIIAGKDVIKDVLSFASILGWASETIGVQKWRVNDKDIQYLVRNCEIEDVNWLLKRMDELPGYCALEKNLHLISQREKCNKYILSHYDELITESGLRRAMLDVYSNPSCFFSESGGFDITTHWLFEQIMTILKIHGGKKDYGYSSLAIDTGIKEIGTAPGTFISPFVARKKVLSDFVLNRIVEVFSMYLSRLGKQAVVDYLDKANQMTCNTIYKYQLSQYNLFNPLDWLIQKALDKEKIPYLSHQNHDSFMSDDVEGTTTSTGNMTYLPDKHVWIKCQTSYDGHLDKRKELCGRIASMKLKDALDGKEGYYYLIIDGSFSDNDIHLLDMAGWNGVFYHDNINILIEHIKQLKNG